MRLASVTPQSTCGQLAVVDRAVAMGCGTGGLRSDSGETMLCMDVDGGSFTTVIGTFTATTGSGDVPSARHVDMSTRVLCERWRTARFLMGAGGGILTVSIILQRRALLRHHLCWRQCGLLRLRHRSTRLWRLWSG